MSEASPLAPDRAAMLRHVELVFGGGFDGALDGLVELAWTDPATGSLRNAQLFGTDQLEELVDRAAELNRVERCNVYVGAALRKPTTPLAKRAADGDFHSAPFAWADIDDDCVEAAIKAAKAAGVPATMTVVTGRHPHMRAQFWWRLVDAERDGAAIKSLCSSIGLALGGDSTVSNPGRVLRLGGSIAWPVILERWKRQSSVRRWCRFDPAISRSFRPARKTMQKRTAHSWCRSASICPKPSRASRTRRSQPGLIPMKFGARLVPAFSPGRWHRHGLAPAAMSFRSAASLRRMMWRALRSTSIRARSPMSRKLNRRFRPIRIMTRRRGRSSDLIRG